MASRHFPLPLRTVTFALACTLLPAAHAQIAGELRGRVVDAAGATVAGAHVTLTQQATGVKQTSVTTSDGIYDFPQLVSGTYTVDVDSIGFAHYQRNGITVVTGGTVGLDLPLAISGSDSVTVNSDAPLLQSQTSNIATTIPGGTIQALPLNSRNFIQLAQLAPGVSLPPVRCCPALTEAARAPTSTSSTASAHYSQNRVRWPSFLSSIPLPSSPWKPTTFPQSLAALTAAW